MNNDNNDINENAPSPLPKVYLPIIIEQSVL